MTPQEWAARAATLPAVLVETTPRAVRAGAEPLETRARENLRADSGGDLRLSRVRSGKNGGARVDVKVDVRGSGSRAQALILPIGPVSLLEGDTVAHREPLQYSTAAGLGGKRRYAIRGERTVRGDRALRRLRVRARAMNIPGIGWRSYVRHPGTSGKRSVSRAMAEAGDVAGRAGAAVFTRAIREHLG